VTLGRQVVEIDAPVLHFYPRAAQDGGAWRSIAKDTPRNHSATAG